VQALEPHGPAESAGRLTPISPIWEVPLAAVARVVGAMIHLVRDVSLLGALTRRMARALAPGAAWRSLAAGARTNAQVAEVLRPLRQAPCFQAGLRGAGPGFLRRRSRKLCRLARARTMSRDAQPAQIGSKGVTSSGVTACAFDPQIERDPYDLASGSAVSSSLVGSPPSSRPCRP